MRTTSDITIPRQKPTAVALGFFDGVHLGHQAVIGRMVAAAGQRGLTPCVFTFVPDGSIPAAKNGQSLLQTEADKEAIMASLGVEELINPGFSAFMGMTPEQYVDELLHGVLHAQLLCCGENYRFGRAAAGDVPLLRTLAARHGIEVIAVPPVLQAEQWVSSTRIRKALREGDPALAAKLLGTPFAIEGPVLPGKKLGRTLGSPTINQSLPPELTVPLHGVYLTRVDTPLGRYHGVTNLGVRPTVDGQSVNCETYLLDFSGDLYGQSVRVAFCQLLRPEKQFESTEALSRQIHLDIETAKNLVK